MNGGAERERLEHDGDAEDGEGPAGLLELVGVEELLDALVRWRRPRPARTGPGRRRRPRSSARGRSRTGARLVAARRARAPPSSSSAWLPVSAREWTRLGQHRGRAGEGEGDELRRGNAEVGEKRGDDGATAAVCHAGGANTRVRLDRSRATVSWPTWPWVRRPASRPHDFRSARISSRLAIFCRRCLLKRLLSPVTRPMIYLSSAQGCAVQEGISQSGPGRQRR